MTVLVQVTSSGNITVPKEMLRAADIDTGDLIEIFTRREESSGREILSLRKAKVRCFFCARPLYRGKFREMYQKAICNTCIETLKREEEDAI